MSPRSSCCCRARSVRTSARRSRKHEQRKYRRPRRYTTPASGRYHSEYHRACHRSCKRTLMCPISSGGAGALLRRPVSKAVLFRAIRYYASLCVFERCLQFTQRARSRHAGQDQARVKAHDRWTTGETRLARGDEGDQEEGGRGASGIMHCGVQLAWREAD